MAENKNKDFYDEEIQNRSDLMWKMGFEEWRLDWKK